MTAPAVTSTGAVRVVIADDHRMFTDALALLIGGASDIALVGAADDGDALLRLIERESPDIAVIDVTMPGPGVLALIGAITARSACRVIVLTMHVEAGLADAVLQAGAEAYVVKQAAFEEVLDAIRAVAHGVQLVSRHVAPADDAPGALLTARELECLQAAAAGLTNRIIAERLAVSERTIRFHFENICRKLDASRRAGAVATALRLGLI